MADPLLEIRQLRISFGDAIALQGLDLTVQPGESVGIVGESGSGKSVACLAIPGLLPKTARRSGQIAFRSVAGQPSRDLLTLPERELRQLRGDRLGFIFQEPMSSLNPVFSCGFQLLEAIQQHLPLSKVEAQQRAIALLQEVQLIREPSQAAALFARYPHQLSGGQRQRLMIAIALAANPDLLLADEPTTALDATVQASVLKLLRNLQRQRQMAMIFVSHDLGVISEVADRVVVLYRGQVVEQGLVADVLHRPQHPYTQGLVACRPQINPRSCYLPTVADFLEGHTEPRSLPARSITEEPLLQIKDLSITYRGRGTVFTAVQNLSLFLTAGATLGLVGESGCGKSSLARCLVGLVPPSHGEIWLDRQRLNPRLNRDRQRLRQSIQMVFQDPAAALDPRWTVGAAILEPLRIAKRLSDRAANQRLLEHWLQRVDLPIDIGDRYPHEFSGGQRQRICIARALVRQPRLLICDESVSALDVSVQAQILNLLKQLQAELGLTYLFISHDLAVVRYMSDRIVVMNQGQLEEDSPTEQLFQNPQSNYTRRLIAAIPGEVAA
ncbi:dipeptide ABC transporter ATP-binding protein [Synechococcus elongatus]|uniref:ABC transporter ATP-binding protein n=1 Tax=Synechococcus elongatus PCC 11802 TaxID=2283154 RepID=A0AAT9JUP1_SYNEL|nr:ABC transporter ATP-binding protein [Synechococcus elongatus]QFZ91756.1 ABC transporter ATP-binding protein [Synechococcus elongatus PCC 11802]